MPKGVGAEARPFPSSAPKFSAPFVGSPKFLPTACQLTPTSLPALRDTSTKRTSSMTCCEPRTLRSFSTSGPYCFASATARAAETLSFMVPERTVRPFAEETRVRSPGRRSSTSEASRGVL